MAKLKRSALLHYLLTPFATTLPQSPEWKILGRDVADMSVDMNPDIETIKNILDETSVNDNGYEPSFDVDTYYADPAEGEFYETLKDISMNRKTGDACKTKCLEVLIDSDEGTYDAWIEDVVVKPQSYGGAQGGVRIPFNVAFCGNREQGSVTMSGKVPTYTASLAKTMAAAAGTPVAFYEASVE